MRRLFIALPVLLVIGCQDLGIKSETLSETEPAPEATAPAPVGSGVAGGMTPMTNTESLQGASGGGTGQAAKDMAKGAASSVGSGTMDELSNP